MLTKNFENDKLLFVHQGKRQIDVKKNSKIKKLKKVKKTC